MGGREYESMGGTQTDSFRGRLLGQGSGISTGCGCVEVRLPGVETPGYFQASLRDGDDCWGSELRLAAEVAAGDFGALGEAESYEGDQQ